MTHWLLWPLFFHAQLGARSIFSALSYSFQLIGALQGQRAAARVARNGRKLRREREKGFAVGEMLQWLLGARLTDEPLMSARRSWGATAEGLELARPGCAACWPIGAELVACFLALVARRSSRSTIQLRPSHFLAPLAAVAASRARTMHHHRLSRRRRRRPGSGRPS